MKKGFTLIELLAVIVILAIIALIAYPTITGIVEKTKMGGAEQSANGFIHAVENQKAINLMDSNDENDLNEGVYDANMDSYNVKVKGQKPSSGWVEVTKNGVNRYSLVIGDYVVTYDGTNKTVVKGTEAADRPGIIVYRFSSDSLHNGDKIDLKNHTYTNYAKWNPKTVSYVSTDETHDMVGIYSTNLNDVLNISTNYDGTSIAINANNVFIKHILNSDGVITKSYACLLMHNKVLCQTTAEYYVEDSTGGIHRVRPDFDKNKQEFLDFFKWDLENSTSIYSGVSCTVESSDVECNSSSLSAKINEFTAYYDNTNLQARCSCGHDLGTTSCFHAW